MALIIAECAWFPDVVLVERCLLKSLLFVLCFDDVFRGGCSVMRWLIFLRRPASTERALFLLVLLNRSCCFSKLIKFSWIGERWRLSFANYKDPRSQRGCQRSKPTGQWKMLLKSRLSLRTVNFLQFGQDLLEQGRLVFYPSLFGHWKFQGAKRGSSQPSGYLPHWGRCFWASHLRDALRLVVLEFLPLTVPKAETKARLQWILIFCPFCYRFPLWGGKDSYRNRPMWVASYGGCASVSTHSSPGEAILGG